MEIIVCLVRSEFTVNQLTSLIYTKPIQMFMIVLCKQRTQYKTRLAKSNNEAIGIFLKKENYK